MKGLVEEVPQHERLITIQDTAELTLPNHPNVVHLFYSKDAQGTAKVTAKSLLEACLRMKPDRIFLAEVRGDECFHFVRLAASGHPGSITSVHAGSCALAFEQMSLMIRESGAGGGLRMAEIKWLLGVVVDVDRAVRPRRARSIHLRDLLRATSTTAGAMGRHRGSGGMSGVASLPMSSWPLPRKVAAASFAALCIVGLACAALYASARPVPLAQQGQSRASALREHPALLGPLRRRPAAAQEADRLDRRLRRRSALRPAGRPLRGGAAPSFAAWRRPLRQSGGSDIRRPPRRSRQVRARHPDRPLPRPLPRPSRPALGHAVGADPQRQGRGRRRPQPAELARLGRRPRHQGRELRHHSRLPCPAPPGGLRLLALRRRRMQPSLEPADCRADERVAPHRRSARDRPGLLPDGGQHLVGGLLQRPGAQPVPGHRPLPARDTRPAAHDRRDASAVVRQGPALQGPLQRHPRRSGRSTASRCPTNASTRCSGCSRTRTTR